MYTRPRIGSLWRVWDLHIHTPDSILNNQFPKSAGKPDWDAYVDALERSQLAVIGATDYFTIDGYRKLKEYQRNGRLTGQTILPNIELRIDKFISSDPRRSRDRLELHVIFSDELDPTVIEDHFLYDLDFILDGRPQGEPEKRKLKKANLEELGRALQSENTTFSGLSPLEVGAQQAVVSFEQIAKRLDEDDRFRGRYVIVLPDGRWSEIPWSGPDHQTRRVLLQSADLVFSSNAKTRSWCLGEDPYADGPQQFVSEFKSLKACIHGSDAHDLASIGKPCGMRWEAGHSCASDTNCDMRYCWIKADPTFEGLQQLLYEPRDRVRCQTLDPTPPRSPYSLASVSIGSCHVSDELEMAASSIDLNPQLVAVVGGRGGGKTAFVDLIANCYTDRVDCDDENSFVKRICGAPPLPSLGVELKFVGGDTFKKAVGDNQFYDRGEVIYIAQGALSQKILDGEALTQQIEEIIFGSPAVADSRKAFELRASDERIDDLTSLLAERNVAVLKWTAAADTKVKADLELASKRAEAGVVDTDARAQEVKKRLSKDRIEEAESRQAGACLQYNRYWVTAGGVISDIIATGGPKLSREYCAEKAVVFEMKYLARDKRCLAIVHAGVLVLYGSGGDDWRGLCTPGRHENHGEHQQRENNQFPIVNAANCCEEAKRINARCFLRPKAVERPKQIAKSEQYAMKCASSSTHSNHVGSVARVLFSHKVRTT